MSDFPSPFGSLPPLTLPQPAAPTAATSAAPGKLHKVAQDFEAIFLRQILAEARKSTMGDTLFSSDATSTFTQMQDSQFADIAAKRDALGLAGMIERQLGAKSQTTGKPATLPITTKSTATVTSKVTAKSATSGAGA